jgi:hypothetical protein
VEVRLVNELFGSGHCALPELLQHSPHLADVYFNDIGFRRRSASSPAKHAVARVKGVR